MPKREPQAPRPRGATLAPLGVFALALLVRLVYLFQIQTMGFFSQPASDAFIYIQRARALAAGDWLGSPDFVHAPLYAYVLGVIRLLGGEFWAYRIVQCVFGATACALLVVIGARLFSRTTGIIAGLLLALYPPALFFDGLIQKTSLTLLLSTTLLWLLIPHAPATPWWRWGLVGVVAGLLALTRQNTLALAPLVVAWIVFGCGVRPWRRRLLDTGVYLAGLVLTLLPWAVRNQHVLGDFVLTTPNFGQNFAMGNTAEATGTYMEFKTGSGRGEDEQLYWTQEVARAIGRTPTAQEVSDYYLNQALTWMRSDPAAWLRLQFKKLWMVCNAYEFYDTEDLYLYREHAPLLRLDHVWHFGVLLPLAAAGLVLTLPQWRRLWLLYGWLVLNALAVVIFVVFGRYRFPLIPVLCVLAAAGLVTGWTQIRRRQFRPLVVAAGVLAVTAVAANWTIDAPRGPQPMSYVNHAAVLREAHRYDDALAETRRALALAPDDVAANLAMCSTLLEVGDYAGAATYGERARAAAPEYAATYAALASALNGLGQPERALELYRRALELDPDDYRAMSALASALARQGQTDAALALYDKLLASAPDFAEGHTNRGNTYFLAGRLDEAARDYERTLALRPDSVEALHNLGQVELRRRRTDRAIQLFERALQIDPTYERARRALEQTRAAQRQ